MIAVTDNPVDLIVAAVILGAIILVGVGAALGLIPEARPCDCLHCQRQRSPRSVPPASGKTR